MADMTIAAPAAQPPLTEVRIYGHSPIVFWWPGWAVAFVLAALTAAFGVHVSVAGRETELVLPQSTPHVVFAASLMMLILFTNVKMRGIYSVTFIVTAYFDLWERIFRLLPYLTMHINFGTALFVLWALTFFVFDKLTYWRVRPGQVVEERLIGGGQRTFDTEGLQFEQRPADLFQQSILGFGAGDLILRIGGVNKTEIVIPNVLLANGKFRTAQRLLSVKPDAPLAA